ncbi:hypothetical protein SAPIO_CDS9950 [Scedosporium apiospermum]|uniref:Nucleoporin NUP53 n=1 Tax=Pseudallescheria apiosperma TaxID=563466 RepID=A0A084FW14_PSEDA|nr:uncharacterized protein SAPIO_CDS9950 [Scedosporium apiospermum]KEZ39276.1 hypothetical protein SAPIO_CDS9950 [Scedosporium apiospermum]
MAPLILHNVPDEELYIGDDGIQRPYAMVFPQQEGHAGSTRSRRAVAETGSFGKSTRRARSRTGTPAKRDNPTLTAADKVFSEWISTQAAPPANASATAASRKASSMMNEEAPSAQHRLVKKEPTEVILRGYKNSDQQYAAINHYEQLAGRICEDYPRQPPLDHTRYKSELRDPAFIRQKPLTPEERAKVNKADGGEHWVKVTFESADAAETAIYASPQSILGHIVHVEPYHGHPPNRDEAIPDIESLNDHPRSRSVPNLARQDSGRGRHDKRAASVFATDHFDPFAIPTNGTSSPDSRISSHTLDSNTLSSATVTDAHLSHRGHTTATQEGPADSVFCRKIPTARRATLLPAEQALLPQQSFTQRIINAIPFLKWFSGSMIGNEVPRTELGDFDWNRASLYWKFIWWLDATFNLFGGEILTADKED